MIVYIVSFERAASTGLNASKAHIGNVYLNKKDAEQDAETCCGEVIARKLFT